MALKARICRTLGWQGFPETRAEFQNYASFRTHHLHTLLRLSGRETRILRGQGAAWLVAGAWAPEVRYAPPGTATRLDARDMLIAVERLLGAL